MSLRRSLPDPADALRAAVPLGLLLLAAAVPASSGVMLGLLVFGLSVAAARGTPVRWAWAATVPVVAGLTWALVAPGTADPAGAGCASAASPPARRCWSRSPGTSRSTCRCTPGSPAAPEPRREASPGRAAGLRVVR